MERAHLLPGNASELEKALSEATDRTPELAPGVDGLHGFKFNPTDVIVPHLLVEYGLTEIEDYFADPRTILAEGIVWQRLRGTPAALHRALDWVGCDGEIEENPVWRFKWWWFQIHLPDERRSSDFAGAMTAVAIASKPLRSEFARVTAGYDKRGFNLNGHRLNGGGLLNSWSGVRKEPNGPVLSLRYHHRALVETDAGAEPIERSDLRHVYFLDGSASTVQRSSLGVSYATVPVSFEADSPFQHAPFTDDAFGLPVPRVQAGY